MSALLERFLSKVAKTETCWIWIAGKSSTGYGAIKISGVQQAAHRASWRLFRGEIPDDKKVLHDCPVQDNKLCVNPDHLYIGTHTDNMLDAVAKGQMPAGDRNGSRTHPERLKRGEENSSRLYPERLAWGDKNPSRLYPERLARGDRNGARLHPEKMPRGVRHGNSKLTEDDVRAIRQSTESKRKTAAAYGVTHRTITVIRRRLGWKHVA